MNRIIIIFLISLIAWSQTSCSSVPSCCVVAPPKINLTGEKTVIERQIVGDYRELEKDSWMISSVKTTVQRSKGQRLNAGGDATLFKALKVRSFHLSKIKIYKSQGSIGENNRGFIVYKKVFKYEQNKDDKNLLVKLIKNENGAREIIFKRSLINSGKKEPSKVEIDAFGKLFAEEQIALAGKNDWIQDSKGAWRRK